MTQKVPFSDVEYKEGWRDAYKRTDERVWQEDPIVFIEDVVDVLRDESKTHLLEPGCGDGRNTRHLLDNGFNVVGLDLSEVALQRIADEASASGSLAPTLLVGDIEDLPRPFPERSFDAVVGFDVFGQLAKLEEAIQACWKLLCPGGLFVANLYTPRDVAFGEGEKVSENAYLYEDTLFRFYDEAELEAMLVDFEIESMKEMSWVDPPHPGYREYPHTHSSLIVWARRGSDRAALARKV